MAGVAMVTGAGRGLGAAIADKLLVDGWSLSIGLREQSQAKRFDVGSDRLHVGHFDALDSASAEQWVNDTVDHFGKINALVNNAGVLRMVDFEKGSEDDLDYLWSVNVKAPFRLIQVALPYLKATGAGRVINSLNGCQKVSPRYIVRIFDDQAFPSCNDPGSATRWMGRRHTGNCNLPWRHRH